MRLLAKPLSVGSTSRLARKMILQILFPQLQNRKQPALFSKLGLISSQLFVWKCLCLGQNSKMVQQTLRQTWLAERPANAIQAALLQRPKRSEQIAAVDGGNKQRHQGRERTRVVPVEQMATMLCETRYRRQSLSRQDREIRSCQISEFNRNLPRLQQEAEISRRDPGCNCWRLLLNIVRDQPVVFLCTEFGEISPCVKSGAAEKHCVLPRKVCPRHSRRLIQPTGYRFAAGPERKNRNRGDQGVRPHQPHQQAQTGREKRHPIEVTIEDSQPRAQLSLRRRLPLQQTLAGHLSPYECPRDGVERKQRLVGEEHQRQQYREVGRVECGYGLTRDRNFLLYDGTHQRECEFNPQRNNQNQNRR